MSKTFAAYPNGDLISISFGKDHVKQEPLAWQLAGLSYTASGYGSKIPTSWKVFLKNKWQRVYCMIYSNSGICYIICKGKRFIVDIECE